MTTALIIIGIVSTILLVSAVIVVLMLRKAPEGYEDKTGYHNGRPK